MANEQPHRVALYWAPRPESALWQAGCQWLGRDAATGKLLPQPAIDGITTEVFEALTAEPRRYGWHATLKPPFRLREGTGLLDLDQAVQTLAGQFKAGTLPALRVEPLGNFLALRPQGTPVAANALAAACVEALQPLSRPLSAEDLQRRRRAPLTPHQDALLQRWGYPWVFDEFRFHCSLTGPLDGLDAGSREALMQAAGHRFNHLPPEPLNSIAIFIEPTPGADFQLHRHLGLST
ncbi:hypothetical protein ASE11_23530 [Hydrogenophaga sp. Root209]|uniref:DUF1045 domain-containing protein n=1 Tax=Hydrogenophaga sp. Root209 TaxID=1736490 RepID=UPI0006F5D26D|nr:DUF1045 domain-containing protein [Hydrogenophaga sp. Root209]KRC06268.1 hypothetical protein ASE11_23530 [Hydrogenophaga sp. Root209]